jgi:hypothetical protein
LWGVQQSAPTSHINLWPNPFTIIALICFVVGVYMLLSLLFQWPLPGGFEGGPTARIPPSRKRKNRLCPGESLMVGQSLYSSDGRTRFVLDQRGNMIVYVQGRGDICDTGTTNLGKAKCLKLEEGGRLVLYDINDRVLWSRGPGGTYLEVQDNSHVVLYPGRGNPIWATDAFVKGGMLVRWRDPRI